MEKSLLSRYNGLQQRADEKSTCAEKETGYGKLNRQDDRSL